MGRVADMFNGGTAKISFMAFINNERQQSARVDVGAAEFALPPISASPEHTKVIAQLMAAGAKAEGKGQSQVVSALHGIAQLIGNNGSPDELRDAIGNARKAGSKSPDLAVTRALLSASRLAHDAAGEKLGVSKTLEPTHEAGIAKAVLVATQRFGEPKTSTLAEPARQNTPAQEQENLKWLS